MFVVKKGTSPIPHRCNRRHHHWRCWFGASGCHLRRRCRRRYCCFWRHAVAVAAAASVMLLVTLALSHDNDSRSATAAAVDADNAGASAPVGADNSNSTDVIVAAAVVAGQRHRRHHTTHHAAAHPLRLKSQLLEQLNRRYSSASVRTNDGNSDAADADNFDAAADGGSAQQQQQLEPMIAGGAAAADDDGARRETASTTTNGDDFRRRPTPTAAEKNDASSSTAAAATAKWTAAVPNLFGRIFEPLPTVPPSVAASFTPSSASFAPLQPMSSMLPRLFSLPMITLPTLPPALTLMTLPPNLLAFPTIKPGGDLFFAASTAPPPPSPPLIYVRGGDERRSDAFSSRRSSNEATPTVTTQLFPSPSPVIITTQPPLFLNRSTIAISAYSAKKTPSLSPASPLSPLNDSAAAVLSTDVDSVRNWRRRMYRVYRTSLATTANRTTVDDSPLTDERGGVSVQPSTYGIPFDASFETLPKLLFGVESAAAAAANNNNNGGGFAPVSAILPPLVPLPPPSPSNSVSSSVAAVADGGREKMRPPPLSYEAVTIPSALLFVTTPPPPPPTIASTQSPPTTPITLLSEFASGLLLAQSPQSPTATTIRVPNLFDLLMSTTHPPAMLANVENSPLREIMNTAAAADDDGDDREDASYYGDVNNAGRQHGRRPPQHHQQRSMRERCGVAADPSSALSTNRLGDGGAALEDWRWTQQHLGDEARVEETLEQCNSPRLATLIRAAIVADDAEASKHAVQTKAEHEFAAYYNVICGPARGRGFFSYIAHTDEFCMVGARGVNCYVFSPVCSVRLAWGAGVAKRRRSRHNNKHYQQRSANRRNPEDIGVGRSAKLAQSERIIASVADEDAAAESRYYYSARKRRAYVNSWRAATAMKQDGVV